jgi:hypothetical protein
MAWCSVKKITGATLPLPKQEDGENYIMRSFVITTLYKILLGSSNQGG